MRKEHHLHQIVSSLNMNDKTSSSSSQSSKKKKSSSQAKIHQKLQIPHASKHASRHISHAPHAPHAPAFSSSSSSSSKATKSSFIHDYLGRLTTKSCFSSSFERASKRDFFFLLFDLLLSKVREIRQLRGQRLIETSHLG